MCQGTSLLVPKMSQIDVGFSPKHSIRDSRMQTEFFRSLLQPCYLNIPKMSGLTEFRNSLFSVGEGIIESSESHRDVASIPLSCRKIKLSGFPGIHLSICKSTAPAAMISPKFLAEGSKHEQK
jgi:hypothetical protein